MKNEIIKLQKQNIIKLKIEKNSQINKIRNYKVIIF